MSVNTKERTVPLNPQNIQLFEEHVKKQSAHFKTNHIKKFYYPASYD